jgi:hypothetical protein
LFPNKWTSFFKWANFATKAAREKKLLKMCFFSETFCAKYEIPPRLWGHLKMLWTKRISSEQRKNNRLSLALSEIKTLLIFVFFTNERTLFKTNNNKSIIKPGHNLWCCLFDGHKSDNTFNCLNVNKINFLPVPYSPSLDKINVLGLKLIFKRN